MMKDEQVELGAISCRVKLGGVSVALLGAKTLELSESGSNSAFRTP